VQGRCCRCMQGHIGGALLIFGWRCVEGELHSGLSCAWAMPLGEGDPDVWALSGRCPIW